MIIEKRTMADGALYRRIPSVTEAVNNALTYQLLQENVLPETIKIHWEEGPKHGLCCPQVIVIAIGETAEDNE